ncbi:hypothetical protein EI94DRAFT_1703855 [Lactarius quietus]|nr:hypothetical protein EI94DRAFT_1703855 [Lactarius quietus]
MSQQATQMACQVWHWCGSDEESGSVVEDGLSYDLVSLSLNGEKHLHPNIPSRAVLLILTSDTDLTDGIIEPLTSLPTLAKRSATQPLHLELVRTWKGGVESGLIDCLLLVGQERSSDFDVVVVVLCFPFLRRPWLSVCHIFFIIAGHLEKNGRGYFSTGWVVIIVDSGWLLLSYSMVMDFIATTVLIFLFFGGTGFADVPVAYYPEDNGCLQGHHCCGLDRTHKFTEFVVVASAFRSNRGVHPNTKQLQSHMVSALNSVASSTQPFEWNKWLDSVMEIAGFSSKATADLPPS